jgi:hypothetical protein
VPPYSSSALNVRVCAYHAPFLLLLIFPPFPVAAQDSLLLSVVANQQAPGQQEVAQALPGGNASGSRPIEIPTTYLASRGFDHSAVLPSTCDVCHNNAVTTGKPIITSPLMLLVMPATLLAHGYRRRSNTASSVPGAVPLVTMV